MNKIACISAAILASFPLLAAGPGQAGEPVSIDCHCIDGTRTVLFTAAGADGPCRWDFGDGCRYVGKNPIHTYASDKAAYKVTVRTGGRSAVKEIGVSGGTGTASSLFWRRDSLQIPEIVSEQPVQYKKVGHHGPAVENAGFALRLYFNDSGAIDIYSKSGKQMELRKYLWYPTVDQQASEGAGCDEYMVGKTVGVGGIALWDGSREVKLKATRGRTARVGSTDCGSFAEIISYGVQCGEESYDISVRVDVTDGDRTATVTARELNGKKVRFLTGVNLHPGSDVRVARGYACVWGVHPSDVSKNPIPLGAGIIYDPAVFRKSYMTDDMVRLVSVRTSCVSTRVASASTKESAICTADLFEAFVRDLSR